jgi:hypothetical protein
MIAAHRNSVEILTVASSVQKSEVRGQKSETGGQKTELRR